MQGRGGKEDAVTITLPLTTERLMLREFEQADWEAVHRYASDPEVVRFMEWGPNSEEETRRFIEKAIGCQSDQPRRNFELAVILKGLGHLIGGCGITLSRGESRRGWIGYCLNRRFWGQGYATEVARALVAFGFEALGLHKIIAGCDTQNVASARVLEKAGMRREGHLREDKWVKGRWRDSFLYAILDHEWKR